MEAHQAVLDAEWTDPGASTGGPSPMPAETTIRDRRDDLIRLGPPVISAASDVRRVKAVVQDDGTVTARTEVRTTMTYGDSPEVTGSETHRHTLTLIGSDADGYSVTQDVMEQDEPRGSPPDGIQLRAGLVALAVIVVFAGVALLGAVALWAVKPARKAALPFGVSLSALIFFAFLAAAAFDFDMDRAGAVQLSETYSWIPPIGASIAWGVNGMGLVMIGLATFLVPLVLLAARDELSDQGEDRAAGYVAWILALEAIVIAIFAARDVFLFYVLFELMILPVYVLVARYGGEGRHRAAIKFVLYSLFGGLVMLAGVIGLAVTASSDVKGSSRLFLVDTLAGHGDGPRLWIFASFFLAFAIKAPLFPVHTWLPDTAEQAPPGTSALLVGVLDKLGVFGMISLCLPIFPKASHDGAPLIMSIAVVSILWGAFMAIASKDLMRLVAYTSVSHFGFIVLGVFSGSHTAMTGAIVYMVAHGVATSALFLTVGFLGRRGPGYAIGDYGGWQRATPLIAGVFLTAGLATIALPGLSGFVPEYLVLVGTFARHPVPACAAVLAVILAAGLKGIEEDYELPAETEDDVWLLSDVERGALGIGELPTSLKSAVVAMSGSDLVADTLGENAFEFFLRNKRREYRAYDAQVTDFELGQFFPRI